jgi:hypothetical protein
MSAGETGLEGKDKVNTEVKPKVKVPKVADPKVKDAESEEEDVFGSDSDADSTEGVVENSAGTAAFGG